MEGVPDPLTADEAEELLALYGGRQGDRHLVYIALDAGLSKNRIHVLSGIARSTIDHYIGTRTPDGEPCS